MGLIMEIVGRNTWLAVLFAAVNLLLAAQLAVPAVVRAGRGTAEALGVRGKQKSLTTRCRKMVGSALRKTGNPEKSVKLVEKTALKLKRAGYTAESAPVVYLLLKYGGAGLLSAMAFFARFPDILPALASAAGVWAIAESVLAANRKSINLKLQKHMYKIYKYLHNQISSGVRVVDAIRTAYEVIDDNRLRSVLVRFAALYELTLDVEQALEEFRSSFDAHEAETLCVVLRQGIETGDNHELLARQEEVMFKKYFNYIQAETDSCKTRCLMAAVMFTAVVVLMIIIPLLNDTSSAMGKIFIN